MDPDKLRHSLIELKQEASVIARYQERIREYTLGAVLAIVSIIGIVRYSIFYYNPWVFYKIRLIVCNKK